MSHRRARSRRRDNVVWETISNKTFIIISSMLILIILVGLLGIKILKVNEKRDIAKEKARIEAQIEDIYTQRQLNLMN